QLVASGETADAGRGQDPGSNPGDRWRERLRTANYPRSDPGRLERRTGAGGFGAESSGAGTHPDGGIADLRRPGDRRGRYSSCGGRSRLSGEPGSRDNPVESVARRQYEFGAWHEWRRQPGVAVEEPGP